MTDMNRPAINRQALIYRRADLTAAIAREESIGRNTGLLHAARRAVKELDRLITSIGQNG